MSAPAGDLRDLYQEVILDHNKQPRNFGHLEEPSGEADGYNPLCGDKVHVTVELGDGRLAGVRFEGEGCAISKASASLMTEAVQGLSVAEVEALMQRFQEILTGDDADATNAGPELGKLVVMEGVKAYPMRIKCATLAWHTLKAALNDRQETVSTE